MIKVLNKILSINPIGNFIVALLYSYLYSYVFSRHMFPVWGYGFVGQYHDLDPNEFVLYLFLSSFPFVFYKGIKYLAASFSLFVYVFVYIPFIYSLLSFYYPNSLRYSYLLFFFFIMVTYFKTDNLTLFKKNFANKKRKIPFRIIPQITIILLCLILFINRSQIHFVNFFTDSEALYEFRELANIQMVYVLCWLRSALLPLMLIYYLNNNEYFKACLPFVGFICIYMLDQQKMTVIFPFAIFSLFFAIKFYESDFKSKFHLFLFAVFTVIPLVIIKFQDNPMSTIFSLIFIYRIQCIAGKQLVKYLDFFDINDNPYTYYSHINIVNAITDMYPYNSSIGVAINDGEGNSNATFFLMDGVASAGLIGCIVIGLFFLVVKSVLNSLGTLYNVSFLTALFLFPLQSLMNVSLFTSLMTHGIIILYIILFFVDVKSIKNKT